MLKLWKKKPVSIEEQISEQDIVIHVPSYIHRQLQMVELTKKDLAVLKYVKPFVEKKIKEIVATFYDRVIQEPLLKEIIENHSSVRRLRTTLEPYVLQMFDGVIDETYIQNRIRVAHVHVMIRLPNKWYLASFQGLIKGVLEAIQPHIQHNQDYHLVQNAVNKIFNFEKQLVVESYEKEYERIREEEYQKKARIQKQAEENVASLYKGIEDSNSAIESIVTRSQEVTDLMEKGTLSAENISYMSHEGRGILLSHSKEVESIVEEIGKVTKDMNELSTIANEMKTIVEIVRGIADETHLLSLNARIESAKAGEFGRTFGIVADRFQLLSDRTKESVVDVTVLIERTVSKVELINEELTKTEQLISKGHRTIEEAKTFFENIVHAIDTNKLINKQILSEVQDISSYLEEINQTTQQIQDQTESLRSILYTLTEE